MGSHSPPPHADLLIPADMVNLGFVVNVIERYNQGCLLERHGC